MDKLSLLFTHFLTLLLQQPDQSRRPHTTYPPPPHSTSPPHTHTYTHSHTHTRARAHAHTHARTCTHARTHKHTHTHTHTYARTHARTHAHTHAHPQMNVTLTLGESVAQSKITRSRKSRLSTVEPCHQTFNGRVTVTC